MMILPLSMVAGDLHILLFTADRDETAGIDGVCVARDAPGISIGRLRSISSLALPHSAVF